MVRLNQLALQHKILAPSISKYTNRISINRPHSFFRIPPSRRSSYVKIHRHHHRAICPVKHDSCHMRHTNEPPRKRRNPLAAQRSLLVDRCRGINDWANKTAANQCIHQQQSRQPRTAAQANANRTIPTCTISTCTISTCTTPNRTERNKERKLNID